MPLSTYTPTGKGLDSKKAIYEDQYEVHPVLEDQDGNIEQVEYSDYHTAVSLYRKVPAEYIMKDIFGKDYIHKTYLLEWMADFQPDYRDIAIKLCDQLNNKKI